MTAIRVLDEDAREYLSAPLLPFIIIAFCEKFIKLASLLNPSRFGIKARFSCVVVSRKIEGIRRENRGRVRSEMGEGRLMFMACLCLELYAKRIIVFVIILIMLVV